MNIQHINSFIKTLFWKVTKRDFIVLNPKVGVFDADSVKIISNVGDNSQRYLPVKYNYHVKKPWSIDYTIRGDGDGLLKYSLSVPSGKPFVEMEMNVGLPFQLNLRLVENELYANGEKLSLDSGEVLPLETAWLVGKFSLRCSDGSVSTRQTGHRIRLDASNASADSSYFNGQVYGNYEENAASVPEQIFTTVEKYKSKKGKFLDVGCATGLTVEYALKRGYDAEGVDFSQWAVEQANVKTGNRCKVVNLDESSGADFSSRYDVISLHSVIEHLGEPEKALGLLFDLCNPGGVVYIETLNADSMLHKILGVDWAGYSDYTHQSPWITADWLVETSKKKGFEILSDKRYYFWNDNIYDDVWRAFNLTFLASPLNVLLEDGYGDLITLVIKKPDA